MAQITACTIVSNNYLPFARVLGRSLREHHPQSRFFVLIVDRPSERIDYASDPFEAVFVEDLDIPAFRNMAFRYNVLELNTAVKPYFLSSLHRHQGCRQLFYFDPDILILGALDELQERLERSDLLLTPHITDQIDDSAHPSERDILNAGVYNMGFLGVSFNRRTLRFLRWWQQRLHRHGINRIEQGLFVDQKWMDFAPAFLPQAVIVRDPGCNVAYWNLQQRRVACRKGVWQIKGGADSSSPLRFFHFSGFSPHDLERISRHQDRFTLSDLPQMRPLFELYARRLREEGYDELGSVPYAYDRFSNGVAVPDCSRQALQDLDPEGRRWPDPFRTDLPGCYFDWLRESAYSSMVLPRLALCYWDQDPYCRLRFPMHSSGDLERFAQWFAQDGARLCGADNVFVAPLRLSLANPARPPRSGRPDTAVEHGAELHRILSGRDPRRALKAWLEKPEGHQVFWLQEDAALEAAKPRINRLALAIHRSRQDLMDEFPHPLGQSRHSYAWWYATSARWEYGLPAQAAQTVLSSLPITLRVRARLWWLAKSLLQGGRPKELDGTSPMASNSEHAESETRQVESDPQPGIHLVGYFEAPTGKGEEARSAQKALEWGGIPHRVWKLDPDNHRFSENDRRLASDHGSEHFGLILFYVNADQTRATLSQLPVRLRSVPYRVGHWDWELSHFPINFAEQFEGLDEIWTSSRFSLRAISALSPLPVRWVPPCIPPGQSEPAARAQFGIPPDSFLFFNAFDLRSIPERKNPEGLLKAFRILCGRSQRPVHLLVKANHSADHPRRLRDLQQLSQGLPVSWITDTLSRGMVDSLMAACDCYVSLHRSEGIGLPLIEAMYARKPVVATGYSGCRDFLDNDTGWPVDYRMSPLQKEYGPYPRGGVWADPDPEHAARRMVEVMEASDREQRLVRAHQRVMGIYSPRAAAERFDREMHRILNQLKRRKR